jgi:hypothetical protein
MCQSILNMVMVAQLPAFPLYTHCKLYLIVTTENLGYSASNFLNDAQIISPPFTHLTIWMIVI